MRYKEIMARRTSPAESGHRETKNAGLLSERTPTKPSPPLTAAKARREQARKDRLLAKAQNARDVCARKVQNLQRQMFEDGDQPNRTNTP